MTERRASCKITEQRTVPSCAELRIPMSGREYILTLTGLYGPDFPEALHRCVELMNRGLDAEAGP